MKRLIQIFNIIVFCVPITMAFCFSLVYYTGGWAKWFPGHTLDFYFETILTNRFATIALYLVLLGAVTGVKTAIDKYIRHRVVVEICLLVLIALILRMILIILNKDSLAPFSDFYRVWEMAHGNLEGNIEYYSLFPAYLNYTVLLKGYLGLVGDTFVNTLVLNVILSVGTTAILYFIAWETTNDYTISFCATLMYAIMPANVIYCSVMTPEFITVFFDSFGVLLLLMTLSQERKSIKAPFLLSGGILIGVGSAYKSFGIIILTAMVICIVAELLLEKAEWKHILFGIVAIAIVFSGYKLTKDIIQSYSEKQLGIELDESKSLPHFLLVGLNTEGEGQIHLGTMSRKYYQTYLENGMDAERAKITTYQILRKDWSDNSGELPALIAHKMIWAWQDDIMPVNYFGAATGDNNTIVWLGFPVVTLTQLFYIVVLIEAMLGCLFSWRDIGLKKEFLLLIIFGYLCLILLSEAQSRYKCLIMPYMCVISGMGTGYTIQRLRGILKSKNTH